MRAGDIVRHGPTGEKWVVAYVRGDYLAWCGWPEGEARVRNCELVEACSDEEHESALRMWGEKPHYRDNGSLDLRHVECKRQLEAWLAREPKA